MTDTGRQVRSCPYSRFPPGPHGSTRRATDILCLPLVNALSHLTTHHPPSPSPRSNINLVFLSLVVQLLPRTPLHGRPRHLAPAYYLLLSAPTLPRSGPIRAVQPLPATPWTTTPSLSLLSFRPNPAPCPPNQVHESRVSVSTRAVSRSLMSVSLTRVLKCACSFGLTLPLSLVPLPLLVYASSPDLFHVPPAPPINKRYVPRCSTLPSGPGLTPANNAHPGPGPTNQPSTRSTRASTRSRSTGRTSISPSTLHQAPCVSPALSFTSPSLDSSLG